MSTQLRDKEWVARAARGDQDAFREIFRTNITPVYWIAHGIVRSAADAEDIAQETFVTAWKKLPDLALAGESVLPWLATICRFTASNHLRKIQRDRANTADAPDDTLPGPANVENTVISTMLAERIVSELGTLTDQDQKIFHLCATEGYAYSAAAAELGISPGAVRNRLSRTRKHLRTIVHEEERA